jgi:alcohol dehydrogenase
LVRPEAIVKDATENKVRLVYLHSHTVVSALIDTAFLDTLSTKYAAAAILDTILAGIESYAAQTTTTLTDTLLQRGIGELFNAAFGLSRNETDPRFRDLAAEAGAMVAVALGTAPQGMGGAAAYTLNIQSGVPKSWIAAVLLPHVVDHALRDLPERIAELAPVMDTSIDEVVTEEAAQVVTRSVRRLVGRMDLPKRLQEFGADLDSLLDASNQISSFPWLSQSRVPSDVEDIEALIRSAF